MTVSKGGTVLRHYILSQNLNPFLEMNDRILKHLFLRLRGAMCLIPCPIPSLLVYSHPRWGQFWLLTAKIHIPPKHLNLTCNDWKLTFILCVIDSQ